MVHPGNSHIFGTFLASQKSYEIFFLSLYPMYLYIATKTFYQSYDLIYSVFVYKLFKTPGIGSLLLGDIVTLWPGSLLLVDLLTWPGSVLVAVFSFDKALVFVWMHAYMIDCILRDMPQNMPWVCVRLFQDAHWKWKKNVEIKFSVKNVELFVWHWENYENSVIARVMRKNHGETDHGKILIFHQAVGILYSLLIIKLETCMKQYYSRTLRCQTSAH